jgi:hypothetical protein
MRVRYADVSGSEGRVTLPLWALGGTWRSWLVEGLLNLVFVGGFVAINPFKKDESGFLFNLFKLTFLLTAVMYYFCKRRVWGIKKAATSINLSEGLTEIPSHSFIGCNDLYLFIIPSHVKVVRNKSFMCCDNLRVVMFLGANTEVEYGAFRDCDNLHCILTPFGSKLDSQQAGGRPTWVVSGPSESTAVISFNPEDRNLPLLERLGSVERVYNEVCERGVISGRPQMEALKVNLSEAFFLSEKDVLKPVLAMLQGLFMQSRVLSKDEFITPLLLKRVATYFMEGYKILMGGQDKRAVSEGGVHRALRDLAQHSVFARQAGLPPDVVVRIGSFLMFDTPSGEEISSATPIQRQ